MAKLNFQIQLFLLALGFYTRLPSRSGLDYQYLSQSTGYLPLVGWVVGSVVAVSFYLATILWSQDTAIILALIVGVLLTGALHEDGFADVCDGFGGGWEKAQILDIMKDSRIGVFGGIGLLLLFLLKISALNSLPMGNIPVILLAGHSFSRWSPLWLMYRYDYARDNESKVMALVYKPNQQTLVLTAAIALLPLLLLPTLCFLALAPVLLMHYASGRYFYHRIGGFTGDCLGSSQQLAEVVFYLSVSAIWTFI